MGLYPNYIYIVHTSNLRIQLLYIRDDGTLLCLCKTNKPIVNVNAALRLKIGKKCYFLKCILLQGFMWPKQASIFYVAQSDLDLDILILLPPESKCCDYERLPSLWVNCLIG